MLVKDIYNEKKIKMIPTRNGYGDGLVELGKKDPSVVVMCCDLSESTRSHLFAEQFPKRYLQVGIAEQNMIGVAAGMALEGKKVFCASYAVFNPGRNWDQIRVSACYNNVNITIVGAHAGISVGPDGATHQALEDIASVRALPNITILAPCDYEQTKKATIAAAKIDGPVYLRFARNATPVMTRSASKFKVGKADIMRKGTDVTIVACGPLVYEALMAAENLSKANDPISVEVINCHTIKPIDVNTIVGSVHKTRAVVSVEEHQITGGLGGAVSEVLAREYPAPMEFVGMPDSFGESGEPQQLLDKYGMSQKGIEEAVKKVFKRK